MSVLSFVDSAKILYHHGKYEEALCLACIAMDACSLKEFPEKEQTADDRYICFLKKHFRTICRYGFPGLSASGIRIFVKVPNAHLNPDQDGYVDMEQILAHVIRDGLVQECSIDSTIQFTKKTMIGDWGETFYLPEDIIWGFIKAVEESEGLI